MPSAQTEYTNLISPRSNLKKEAPNLLKELNSFIEKQVVSTLERQGNNHANIKKWLLAGGGVLLLGTGAYLFYLGATYLSEHSAEQKPYQQLIHQIYRQIEEHCTTIYRYLSDLDCYTVIKRPPMDKSTHLPRCNDYAGDMERCEWRGIPGPDGDIHNRVAEYLFDEIKKLVPGDPTLEDLVGNYTSVSDHLDRNPGSAARIMPGFAAILGSAAPFALSEKQAKKIRAVREGILNQSFADLGFSTDNAVHQQILKNSQRNGITVKDMLESIRDRGADLASNSAISNKARVTVLVHPPCSPRTPGLSS